MTGSLAFEAMTEARRRTGLDDFGADEFREGLEIYCAVGHREADLNDFGTVAIPANVIANLANRLRVVDWAERHPEVADEEIDAPLFVIGMFRAGTTLLSYLLDQDRPTVPSCAGRRRTASRPRPRPTTAAGRGSRRRGRPGTCSRSSTRSWPPSTTRSRTARPSASPS